MACFDFTSKAKDKVLIESNSGAADAYGGRADSWGTQSNVWAYVEPLSHRQSFSSDNLQSTVTHKIIIRYQSALANVKTTVKYRATIDSRLYDIVTIKNVDEDLKGYGSAYQIILANEAGPDV